MSKGDPTIRQQREYLMGLVDAFHRNAACMYEANEPEEVKQARAVVDMWEKACVAEAAEWRAELRDKRAAMEHRIMFEHPEAVKEAVLEFIGKRG